MKYLFANFVLVVVIFSFGYAYCNDGMNAVWIDMDGDVYRIDEVLKNGVVCYRIFNGNSECKQLSDDSKRKLAVLHKMYFSRYLDFSRFEELNEFYRSMCQVRVKHYEIATYKRLRDEFLNVGVIAASVYCSGGSIVFNKAANIMTDELIDYVVENPKTVALNWARYSIEKYIDDFSSLLSWIQSVERDQIGKSKNKPVEELEIQKFYKISRDIDIYMIPTMDLLVSLQPSSSTVKQLIESAKAIGKSIAGVLPGKYSKIAKITRGAIYGYSLYDAVRISVPNFEVYEQNVLNAYNMWEAYDAGTGEQYVNAPIYSSAVFCDSHVDINASDGRSEATTVLAIIDSSGSMKTSDPYNLRNAALQMMIDSLGPGSSLGVIDFDSHAREVSSPVSLGPFGSSVRNELFQKLNSINAEGGTAIGAGLSMAATWCSGSSEPVACILMTDGLDHGWSGEKMGIPDGVPVHTIALSDHADTRGLSLVSRNTGGISEVASSADDLSRIFANLFALGSGSSFLAIEEGNMTMGEVQEYSVWVDPSVESMQAQANWRGSDIDLSLRSPSGKIYTIQDAVRQGYGTERRNYDIIRLQHPESGQWTARLQGVDLPPGGEPYSFRVQTSDPVVNVRWNMNIPIPQKGDDVVMTLSDNSTVNWGSSQWTVWTPDGQVQNGTEPLGGVESMFSGGANHRVWAMHADSTGAYRVKIQVEGVYDGSRIVRVMDRSFSVVERGRGMLWPHEIDPFIRRGAHAVPVS